MEKITFEKLNIPIKKILIGIGILIGISSFGLHIWTGLTNWMNETEELVEKAEIQMINNSYRRGLIIGANTIIQQIKSGMNITFEEGIILFVPKSQ